ncbi:MAG: glycosyltransferase family 2 protein [Burkholderiales bacterium]|nr:glycosyltransferase family 2 protein [Burkholderiales bacterium]
MNDAGTATATNPNIGGAGDDPVTLDRPSVAVVVIALNEAARIAHCLKSATFADEIVLIDAGSGDDTVRIARECGARVYTYADWQGFGVQRSRALAHVESDYVFWLDADEVVTPTLAQQILACLNGVRDGRTFDAASMRWQPFAYGRMLRHYREQQWNLRLIRRALLAGYDGVVHEAPVWRSGEAPEAIRLRGRLEHHTRESVASTLAKVRQYAILGARKRREAGRRGGVLRGMAAATRVFVLHYFGRLACLSGGAGFLFAQSLAHEAFFKYAILGYDSDVALARRD